MSNKYRIGEISKIKNIDKQTLRYYDKLGILIPKVTDSNNQYRYYTVDQFFEVDCIKFCKMLGLSLDEIKEFKEERNLDKNLKVMKKHKEKFRQEIQRKQAILKNIEMIIEEVEAKHELYQEIGDSIVIKNIESFYGVEGECNTANDWYEFEKKLKVLMSIYPNYSEIGMNKELLFIYDEAFLKYSDEEEMSYVNKIIMPIDEEFKEYDNVKEYKLGKCILIYHKGGYDIKKRTFDKVSEYIKLNGIKTKGYMINRSIIEEFVVNNPDEFLMEIMIPIW